MISQEHRFGILETGRIPLDQDLQKLFVNNQRVGILTMEDQAS